MIATRGQKTVRRIRGSLLDCGDDDGDVESVWNHGNEIQRYQIVVHCNDQNLPLDRGASGDSSEVAVRCP